MIAITQGVAKQYLGIRTKEEWAEFHKKARNGKKYRTHKGEFYYQKACFLTEEEYECATGKEMKKKKQYRNSRDNTAPRERSHRNTRS